MLHGMMCGGIFVKLGYQLGYVMMRVYCIMISKIRI